MRKVLFWVAVVLGLTVAGSASAAIVDDGALTRAPVATPQTFAVELEPIEDPEGSGNARLIVNPITGTVCYVITVTGIGEPTEPAFGIGTAHIHTEVGGGVAVDLETQFKAVPGAEDTYRAVDCVTASPEVLAAILANPELYYVNVHTTEFPGGAVQGNLA